MFNQQKMLEQIGFPIPQPPKMYKPRYKESVLRFLASFLIGFLTKLFTLPFDFSTSCWGITYGFVVLYLHIKKIPKEPSFGAEIKFAFQNFILYLVTYSFLDCCFRHYMMWK